jgi:hypothetical protein
MNATYWLAGINKKTSMDVVDKTARLLQCPFHGKLL